MNKREYKKQQLVHLGFLVILLALGCFISNHFFFRFDLTGDRRYTVSSVTKEVLAGLDDQIYIRIYLDGDLPAGFRRMRRSVREMIDEFRVFSSQPIQYRFIDPAAIDDRARRDDLYYDLYNKGLRPTNIEITEKGGGRSQKLVFPGAVISYKGSEIAVNFLKNNPALTAEQNLNNSVRNIEYEIISSIHTLMNDEVRKVAFLEGHGELDELLVSGISDAIARYYDIYRGRIDINDLQGLDDYHALIVAKPQEPFSEAEKYIIDQYVMKGGKIMWFIDPVAIDLDSLTDNSRAVALVKDLNLDDQLFRYGVRVNPNLVMDMNCLLIPLNVALEGEQPRFVPSPWFFSPLLAGNNNHPVTTGINYVKAEFASVIDTVGNNPNLNREVLLRTSEATRVMGAPLIVSLDMAGRQPDPRQFTDPYQPVAVLLEGEFPSVFANRSLSGIIDREDPGFTETSVPNRMLIVADGDILRNDVAITQGVPEPLPLGYDRYSGQTFGNREFVLNALNYLLDDAGLMALRTREMQLRLLDRSRVREELVMWQAANMILPPFLVVAFGLIYNLSRRRRFASGK